MELSGRYVASIKFIAFDDLQACSHPTNSCDRDGNWQCDECATPMEMKDLRRCAECRLVPSSLAGGHSISHLVAPESPPTVSVSPGTRYLRTLTLNLPLPRTRSDAQSRGCQKVHWKWVHRMTCSTHAQVRKNHRKSPKEKALSRRVARWMDTWSPTIALCSPIALDLANHKWGRHDTHRYVPYTRDSSSRLLTYPILTRSLVMFMERTDLDGDSQSFRVRKLSHGLALWREVCPPTAA